MFLTAASCSGVRLPRRWLMASMSLTTLSRFSGRVLSASSISQFRGAPVTADNFLRRVRVGSFLNLSSLDSQRLTAGLDTPRASANCCWVIPACLRAALILKCRIGGKSSVLFWGIIINRNISNILDHIKYELFINVKS